MLALGPAPCAAVGARAGSILISVDPVKGDVNAGDPAGGAAIGGDAILIASASLWSMVMVRQSKHAPHFSPVTLATVKARPRKVRVRFTE